MPRILRLLALVSIVAAFGPATVNAAPQQQIEPKPANYARLAFYPDRWRRANISFDMQAWEGDKVVLLTKSGELDRGTISAFVGKLDAGWQVYSDLVGAQPRRFKEINNKPTICAIPKSNLSCGYGCGYVGATGIEVSAFYSKDLREFRADSNSFRHYYFYEMGRNFFVFGDRHSLFTTGYAVFMRYVCMDKLKCTDTDRRTRQTIEGCEQIYADSDVAFLDAFTNLGDGEKRNRLRDADGRVIFPSDQPVMYATAMLKLRRDYGGDAWVKRFLNKLGQCKPAKARDQKSARTQIYNWLVCASAAAAKDLTPVFVDRWRMPLSIHQRRLMQSTKWDAEALNVRAIVDSLLKGGARKSATSNSSPQLNIVPTPTSAKSQEGFLQLGPRTRIVCVSDGGAPLLPLANVFASEIEILTGTKPTVVSGVQPTAADINLRYSEQSQAGSEAYQIRSSPTGLQIEARAFAGVAYGTSTVLQMLDPETLQVPSATITDAPSAEYRAVMIDVARNVHSIGVIKDVVRLCRLYKVRYLHLHLTDDQNFTFPFPPVTDNIERNFSYSLDELKNLVTYAESRGVTIIPELDLPGHSTKLKQSGYLTVSKHDADVASPENYDKIGAIVDAMLDVFHTSPYFHIGGDESGAGRQLVPFLAAINRRVRKRGKRLLVWEGFHGSPTDALPATGDNRIIVLAWESSYNAPWDLLRNGYQVINASWKPMYLTGGYGGLIHPGSTGGKRWPRDVIYRWDKNTFMHWEPGRPVFEDRGPNDENRDDGKWNASWIGKQDQILGGQLLYWEQQEGSVIRFLRERVPVMSERLWNPEAKLPLADFKTRADSASKRVLPILQPIEIRPVADDQAQPVVSLYQPYEGDETKVTLRNRTKLAGRIRYSEGGWSGSLNSPNFRPAADPNNAYVAPITIRGPGSIRAELVREDDTPVDGQTWQYFNNWPNRVEVTEYNIGRRTPRQVPDLAAMPESMIVRRYPMPYLRGLMQNVDVRGQLTVTDLVAPATGEHTLELRTQSGHATLYFDINQDGRFERNEVLIKDSPNDESGQFAKVTLNKGLRYRIRIDHATGIPRPVLLLFITRPDTGQRSEISQYLKLPG